MKWLHRAATGVLLLLGLVAWLLGIAFMALTMLMAVIGKMIPHDPTYGNCWTSAMPKFYARGGYLLIRPADKVRLLGFIKIMHVAWVKTLPKEGLEIEQFDPITRSGSRWIPWRTIWYHGRVKRTESAHPAKAEPG